MPFESTFERVAQQAIIYGKIEHIRRGEGVKTLLKIFVLEDEWIQQSRIESVLQELIRS